MINKKNLTFICPSFTQDTQITSTKMTEPVSAVRYIKSQLIFYTLLLLLYIQQEPSLQVTEANTKVDWCSNPGPTLGKGNRRGRQNSESSTSSSDPIESLVNPETLVNGEGPLIGPEAARELDKRRKKNNEEKEDDGSLNIKIHLDLHAKVRLDLEADLYGDIVIGLLWLR